MDWIPASAEMTRDKMFYTVSLSAGKRKLQSISVPPRTVNALLENVNQMSRSGHTGLFGFAVPAMNGGAMSINPCGIFYSMNRNGESFKWVKISC